MHREVRSAAHFQISPRITEQRPNHLERALFVTRTLHSAWGREGGAACVSAISVPPVPCLDRNESHGNTPVLAPTVRPRPVVPPFLCTTWRLIGNNVAGTFFSAATDLEWPRCDSEDSKSEFTQLFDLSSPSWCCWNSLERFELQMNQNYDYFAVYCTDSNTYDYSLIKT